MKTIDILRRTVLCACTLGLPPAHAEDAAQPTPVSPAVAPFDSYQAWRDTPVADWRETNARVEAAGGWRAYLRESQPADADDAAQHHHHHH